MKRLPLSTELGLVAFVLLFPVWMIDPIQNPWTIMSLLVAQSLACVGSFIARRKEKAAYRAELQAFIDKIKKRRENQ